MALCPTNNCVDKNFEDGLLSKKKLRKKTFYLLTPLSKSNKNKCNQPLNIFQLKLHENVFKDI